MPESMDPRHREMTALLKKLKINLDDDAARKTFLTQLFQLETENPKLAGRFERTYRNIIAKTIERDWQNPAAKMLELYKGLRADINDEKAWIQFMRGLFILNDRNPKVAKHFFRVYNELVKKKFQLPNEPVKIKFKLPKPKGRVK